MVSLVNEAKKERQQATPDKPDIFTSPPDSILNHYNNQQTDKVTHNKGRTQTEQSVRIARKNTIGHVASIQSSNRQATHDSHLSEANFKDKRSLSPQKYMRDGSPQGGKGVQFESVTVEDKPEVGGGVHSYSGSTEPLVTDSNSSDASDDLPLFEKNTDGEPFHSILNKAKL